MGFDGFQADTKLAADIPVRAAFRDQLHHPPLARGQRVLLALPPPVQQRVEQLGRYPARDIGLVPRQGPNGGDQVVVRVAFQKIAARADGQDVLDDFLAVVQGEDQHLGARQLLADFPRGLDAIVHRHGVIEDHQVGLEPYRGLDGFLAVSDLAHDLEPWLRLEDGAKAGADNVVIVGDKDPGHVVHLPRCRWSFVMIGRAAFLTIGRNPENSTLPGVRKG